MYAGLQDCTIVLKFEVSKAKPNRILLLFLVIGGMDAHVFACNTEIRRHGENREGQSFCIVIFSKENLNQTYYLRHKKLDQN